MSSSNLRTGREVLPLTFRPKAGPPPTPTDSYGIQRRDGGNAPTRSGWRPTAALMARAAIGHSEGSRFWPCPGRTTASELRKNTRTLRGDGAVASAPR